MPALVIFTKSQYIRFAEKMSQILGKVPYFLTNGRRYLR